MKADPLIRAISLGSINRLAKWRSILAGWQLGTRSLENAESNAVRDHREVTLLLRSEMNAVVGLLIERGVFTADEFLQRNGQEAEYLMQELEKRFPGAKAIDNGMSLDPEVFLETTKKYNFPP